jgi:hypothetical protein
MKAQHKPFAVLSMIVFSTPSFAQQMKTDYDHSADFSHYKTYSWLEIKTQSPLSADRIKNLVNTDLAARGWTLVPSGGDTAVVAIETTRTQQTLDSFYEAMRGDWHWGGITDYDTSIKTYTVGTLVVDIFDASTKNLIWRGSSSDTFSNKSEKNVKNLDKNVQKMFDHFPPGAKN